MHGELVRCCRGHEREERRVESLSLHSGQLRSSDGLCIPLEDVLATHFYEADKGSESGVVVICYSLDEQKRRKRRALFFLLPRDRAREAFSSVQATRKLPIPPHSPVLRQTRRVLVLTNPFSGRKQALPLWTRHALPILSQVPDLDCQLLLTQKAGHATEVVKSLDLNEYDMIVINSGDGLVSEVLAGLLVRRDLRRALRIPLAHFPGGTSNALAASLCYASGAPFNNRATLSREVALMIAQPRFVSMQLYRVEIAGGRTLPMFLSTTWGFIADIDIESERFRCVGEMRLTLEALVKIAKLPSVAKFSGRIWYLPADSAPPPSKRRLGYSSDRREFGENHFNYEEVTPQTQEEMEEEKQLEGQFFPSLSASLESLGSRLLPPLSQPIDDPRFVCLEGVFLSVCLTTLSHIGTDQPYLPITRLDEDILYLTVVDWKDIKSRLQILNLLMSMESSGHLEEDFFQVIPVRAARIEPLNGLGNVAVDGEACGKGIAFQAEALPVRATVAQRWRPSPAVAARTSRNASSTTRF